MSPIEYSEDRLVQKTTADYFEEQLKWDSIFAYNDEVLGVDGTLGRRSEKEIILIKYLLPKLVEFNPNLPNIAYNTAIKHLLETSISKSSIQTNKEKYEVIKNGIPISYKNENGIIEKRRLRLFDFAEPGNNHFLVVRELWVQGPLYRRRPDIIGFVNGIPLLFFELKNIHKDIRRAYNENLSDYKDTIPHIFHFNGFIVLSNGSEAKVGSFSAKYEHFHEWKRLDEDEPGVVDMETMLKGMCTKKNFMDIIENFIVFDDSKGSLVKILAKNHQYLGVNRAIESVEHKEERLGKLGVFWHTQGSGKSYSMVFFSQKVHRKLRGNYTFLIVTDREDLDTQIYKTFAGCGIVDNDVDECRASSGNHLKELLGMDKAYVFSMIHKFNKDVDPEQPYNKRGDIIVISDEAHRTQYGRLAINMRYALPNASYIGFTGTPLFKDDEITKKIFGDYVSTYDFQRAVDDKATVPLFYDNRGEKLKITMDDINQRIAEKLEELDLDQNQQALLEQKLGQDYPVYTAQKRLKNIANDFVKHYTKRWETGKAMLICIDKITTVKMYNLIQAKWQNRIQALERVLKNETDEQEEVYLTRQINWLKETEIAVVISEEQGEVDLFRKWELDIIPHRTKIKNGYETPDGKRLDIDVAFKKPDHKFRIAIVCAMWLTGFDVESLSTMYIDKPLKAHTLMQAIARANRVYEGKNNGLIVDYGGILKNLREALATFTVKRTPQGGELIVNPVKPEEELLEELEEAIETIEVFLREREFELDKIIESKGYDRIAAINEATEVINKSEETRKRFEILARETFKKYKACFQMKELYAFRERFGAIDIIYKRLQDDKQSADITKIIKELQGIVDEAIKTHTVSEDDEDRIYDISKIDFEKLQEEFKKSKKQNTTVYCLKDQVEKRLKRMIERNPLRTDLYKKYQEIIADYNLEKDRSVIEKTFADLIKYIERLDEEDKRAIKEGLNEESLALFDLLEKPELKPKEREKVKLVAKELLEKLKAEYLKIKDWREKETIRAAVNKYIQDYLWADSTGLPTSFYNESEVNQKAALVFNHIYRQYQDTWHNAYVEYANDQVYK